MTAFCSVVMDLKGFTTVDEVGADDSQVRHQEENFKPATAAEEIDYLNKILADIEKSNGSDKGKKFGCKNDIERQDCRDNNDNVDQQCVNKNDKENEKYVCYRNTRPRFVIGKDSERQKPVSDNGIEGQNSGCESFKEGRNFDCDCENEVHVCKVQKYVFGTSGLSHVDDILTQADDQHMLNHNTVSGQVQSGLSTEPSLITVSLSFPQLNGNTRHRSDSNLINPNISADLEDSGKFGIGHISVAALNETGSSELSPSTTNATIVPVDSSTGSLSMLESRCYSAGDISNSYLSGEDVSQLTEKNHKDLDNDLTFSNVVVGSVSPNITDATIFPVESSSVLEPRHCSERNTSNSYLSGEDVSGINDKIKKDLTNELTFSSIILGDINKILANSGEQTETVQEEESDLGKTQIDLSLVKSEPIDVDPQEEFDFDGFLDDPAEEFKVKEEPKVKDEPQDISPETEDQVNLYPVKVFKSEDELYDQPDVIPNVRYLVEGDNYYSREQITAALIISQSSLASTIDMDMFQNVGRTKLVLNLTILEEIIINPNQIALEDADIVKLFVKNYGSSFSEWKKFFSYKVPSSRKHTGSSKKSNRNGSKDIPSLGVVSTKGRRRKEKEKGFTSKKIVLKTKYSGEESDWDNKEILKSKAISPKEGVTKKGKRKNEHFLELPKIQTIKDEENLVCHITNDIDVKSAKNYTNSLTLSDLTKGFKGDGKQESTEIDVKESNDFQWNVAVDMKEKTEKQENFAIVLTKKSDMQENSTVMTEKNDVEVCLGGKRDIQEQKDSEDNHCTNSTQSSDVQTPSAYVVEGFDCDGRPVSTAVDMKEKFEHHRPKDSVGVLTESLIPKQQEILPKVDSERAYASSGEVVASCSSAYDKCLDTHSVMSREETVGVSESDFMQSVSDISNEISEEVKSDSSADSNNLNQDREISLDTKCKPCSIHLFDIAKDKQYQEKVELYLRLHKGKRFVTESDKETFMENEVIEFPPRVLGTCNRDMNFQPSVCVGLQSGSNEMDGSTEKNSGFVQFVGNKDKSLDTRGEKADKNSNILFVERSLDSEADNSDEMVITSSEPRGNEDASKVENEAPNICTKSLRLDDQDKLVEKMDTAVLVKEDKDRFEKENREKKRLKYEKNIKQKDTEKEEEDIKKLQEEIKKLKEEKKVLIKNKIYDHVKWKNEKIKEREKKLQELLQRRKDRETRVLEKEVVPVSKECTVVTSTSLPSITTFRIPKKKLTNVRQSEVQEPTSVLSKREEWLASKKSVGYSSNKMVYDRKSRRLKGDWNPQRIADTRNQNKTTLEPGFPPHSRMKDGWTKKEMHQIPGREAHSYDSPMSGCGVNDSPGSGYDRQQYGSSVEHEMTVPLIFPSQGVERWGIIPSSSMTEAKRKDPSITKSPLAELEKLQLGPAVEHDTEVWSFHAPPPPLVESWVSTSSRSMSEHMYINSFSNESSPANLRNSPDNSSQSLTDSAQIPRLNMPELGTNKIKDLMCKGVNENKINTDSEDIRMIEYKAETLLTSGNKETEEIKPKENDIINQFCNMDKKQKMRHYEKRKRQYYEAKKKYHDEKGEKKQWRFEEYERRKKEYYDMKRYLYEEKKKEYELKKKIQKENLAKLKAVKEDPKVQIEGSQKDNHKVPEPTLEDSQVKESDNDIHSVGDDRKSPYSPSVSPVTFNKKLSVTSDSASTLGEKTLGESVSSHEQVQEKDVSFTRVYKETTTTPPTYDIDVHPSYEQVEKESLTEALYRYEQTLTSCTSAYDKTEPTCSPNYEETNPACRSVHDSELKDILMTVLKPLRQPSVTESRDKTDDNCIPSRSSNASDFVCGFGTPTSNLSKAKALEPGPSPVSVQSSISWPVPVSPSFSVPHLPPDTYPISVPVPKSFPTVPVSPPLQVSSSLPVSSPPSLTTAYPVTTSSASSLPVPLINPPALPVLPSISVPHPSDIASCAQLTVTSVLPDSLVISASEQSSSHLHSTSQVAGHCSNLLPSSDNCMLIDGEENVSQASNDILSVHVHEEGGASVIIDDARFLATFNVSLNSPQQDEKSIHHIENESTRQSNLRLGKLISKLMETSKQREMITNIHRRKEALEPKGAWIEGTKDVPKSKILMHGSQKVMPVMCESPGNINLYEAAAVDMNEIQAVAKRKTFDKPSCVNEPLLSPESTDQHTELEVVYSCIQEGGRDKKRTLGDEVPKYYQKMPLAQAVVDDCQDIPLVGLQYVLEVRQDVDVTIDGCYYICAICCKKMNAHTLIAHIKSVPHRLKFSEIHCRDIYEKYGTYSLKQWTAVLVKEFTMALAEVEAKMGRHKLAVAFEKDMSSVLTSLKDKINEISELSSKPMEKNVEENGGDPVNQTPPNNEGEVPIPSTTSEETATSLTKKDSPLTPSNSSSEKAVPLNKLTADKKGDKADKKGDKNQTKEKEKQPQETSDDVVILKDVKKASGQGFQKRNYRPGPNSRRRSSSKSPSKSLSPKRRTRSRSPSPRRRKSRSPSSKRIKSSRHSPPKESGIRSQTGDRKRRYSRSPGSRSRSHSRSRSRGTRIRRSHSRSHSRGPRSHRRSRSRSRSRQRSAQKRPERWFRRSPVPRRRESSEERSKRVAERKLQDFREVEIRLKARHKNEQVVYEKNPESHPQYTQEWKMFWEHRCQQLVKQGLNPFQYDFKSEWALFWPQRMRELLAIEYKSKRNSLLARFNMEDPDESNVETNKTTNSETNPSWNSAGAKRDTISRIDRSPSPWEGDSISGAKVKNPSPPAGIRMSNSVTGAPPQNVEPSAKKFEDEFSVLGTLKLLNELEDQLGSFGPAITTLLGKAVDCSQKGGDALELFKDPDNLVLVRYAREKLSSQISAGILGVNALVCTQMAVERAMWLQSQAEKLTNEGKYLGLDIASIARATLGKDTVQIAQFIAQHLLQVGKSNASEEDLQNILFAVSSAHTKSVVEHAAKQTQGGVDVPAGPVSSSYAAANTEGIPQKTDTATGIPQKAPTVVGIPQKAPTSSNQESQRPKPLFPSAMSAQATNSANDSKSSDTKSAGLSMLQSAYDDENAKDMEKLSIEDLQSLLGNFRSLVPEEQQALTAYLKKLEATDSKKVMKLREEMQKSAKNAAKMAKPTASTTVNSHRPSTGLNKDAQHPGSDIPTGQQPAQAVPPPQLVYSGSQNKVEISKPPQNYVSGENNLHSRSPLSISEAFREFASSDYQTNNPQDNVSFGDTQNTGSRRPFMEKEGPSYSGLDTSHQRYQEPGNQDYFYRDRNKPLGPEGPHKYGMPNYYSNYNKGYPPRGNQFPNNPNRPDEENWFNDRPRHSYGPPSHF
ncbi:uncharacterized protein [Panulirus ornatus]|uniref:uncharacterized protein n=1 Tax=Panulirus ornatus TaxID=150431 RepID=UPI003A8B91CB